MRRHCVSQRREEEEEEDIPTENKSRPSFPRSVKRNPPTRYTDYHEDIDSDGDYDDIYAPPSSSSASSSENTDEDS